MRRAKARERIRESAAVDPFLGEGILDNPQIQEEQIHIIAGVPSRTAPQSAVQRRWACRCMKVVMACILLRVWLGSEGGRDKERQRESEVGRYRSIDTWIYVHSMCSFH